MNSIKKINILHWTSVLVIVAGLSVVIGWVIDIPLLKTAALGHSSMKINTSIGFILSGIAFYLLLKKQIGYVYKLIALFLIVFGIATILQKILNYDFGIDQLLIADIEAIKSGEYFPGSPSSLTAFCFSLIGFIFLFFDNSNDFLKKISINTAYIVVIISFINIESYIFNFSFFYKNSQLSPMSLYTSLLFFMLSTGISFADNNRGLAQLFVGEKMGNIMARKLFSRIVLGIFVLGLIRLVLFRQNIISGEIGIAFFTTAFILIAINVISSTAIALNKIDFKRKEAELKIQFSNKNLEKTVLNRTLYLTQQNKQLEDFAYIISHNLRSSVSNLSTLLYFYKEEEIQSEKDDLMSKFETTVGNIETTLNNLLDIIKIKYDSKNERKQLYFKEFFSKIKQTFEPEIIKTKAEVTADFSNAPKIEYLSIYLESILQNMLSNALKYHSPERTPVIHFKTYKNERGEVLEVSDNGLGIDLKKHGKNLFGMNKIFHKHPDAKGVGLFMTKAQIEGMGGEITVSSEVNKGTTFTIFFNTIPEKPIEDLLF